jgi:hypothetical protein
LKLRGGLGLTFMRTSLTDNFQQFGTETRSRATG